MSDLTSRISKFTSLDLGTYLNEVIPRYERVLLETEKHSISKVEREIDTELLREFLKNSNNLLSILNTYEESYKIVTQMVDLSKEFIRFHLNGYSDEDVLVDNDLIQKFRSILEDFSDDADVFATPGRYLVHFDVLEEKNEGTCILILTNDIFIIGAVQIGAKKYKLLNAYSYSIIQLDVEDEMLRISVEPTSYVFRKDKRSIEEIVRIYQELTYRYDEKKSHLVEEPEIDKDLIDYLAFTEQYECIEPKGFTHSSKIVFHDKNEMFKYLSVASLHQDDISSHVYPFLEERFRIGLKRINKIQLLNDLVENVFGYFNEFFNEQNELISEVSEIGKIRRGGLILLIENELKACFEVLENRIFNREIEVMNMNSSLNLIRTHLRFSNCDFSYLMDYFMRKKDGHRRMCVESAMKEIERIVNGMVE